MTTRYQSSLRRFTVVLGLVLCLSPLVSLLHADDPKPDPAGTATGMAVDAQSPAGTFLVTAPADLSADDKKDPAKVKAYDDAKKAYDDFVAQNKTEPLAVKLADSVGHNRVAINFEWTLITGLSRYVHAGGICLGRNRALPGEELRPHHGDELHDLSAWDARVLPLRIRLHVWWNGRCRVPIGGGISTMGGYAGLNHELGFMLGGHFIGLLGWKGFMLQGAGYDTAAFALFLFQMVFMDTTATIPTGAAAERWRFSAFMIYGCLLGMIMYPVFGNWVWGNGWLAEMGANWGIGHGHVDFAGSSVVHMQGGVIALIFAWLIGPRHGKYDANGKLVNPIVPAQHPDVYAGHLHPRLRLVWVQSRLVLGWHGFAYRRCRGQHDARLRHRRFGATLYMWWFKTKKPDPAMMCNGMLAGLVAITCPCAFVSAGGASIIGLVCRYPFVESVFFFDKIRVDDPVGAISVHGVNGAWGCLSLGLFADGTYGDGWNGVSGTVKGLFYGGGWAS